MPQLTEIRIKSPSSPTSEVSGEGSPGNYYLWFAAGYFAMAIYGVVYAEHLTQWAFKENVESDADKSPDASEI